MPTPIRLFLLLAIWLLALVPVQANEGLWLPLQIPRLVGVDLQQQGLQLTAEEIYSINQASLKDAIVALDGTCSGSIISSNGLLLTNYHCVMQRLGQLEQSEKIIQQGYWAYNQKRERPIPGMVVKKLQYMEDVTAKVLSSLSLTQEQYQEKVEQAISDKEQQHTNPQQKAEVKSFRGGNEFYLFVYTVYRDVRLVGVPAFELAQFGGRKDNWEWPRLNADFALLRLYNVPKSNEENNSVPLKNAYHLPISTDGYHPGEFTLILGYPHKTQRYHYPSQWSFLRETQLPHKARLSTLNYNLLLDWLNKNPEELSRLRPALSELENRTKFWNGQLNNLNDPNFKHALTSQSAPWYKDMDQARLSDYQQALEQNVEPYLYDLYLNQGLYAVPAFALSYQFGSLVALMEKQAPQDLRNKSLARLKKRTLKHFESPATGLDLSLLITMLQAFYEHVPLELHPNLLTDNHRKYKGDFQRWGQDLKKGSMFFDQQKVLDFLEDPNQKTLIKDPLYELSRAFLMQYFGSIYPQLNKWEQKLSWMKHLDFKDRPAESGLKHYDANGTLRLSTGSVKSFNDGQGIAPFNTTLAELIDKANTEDAYHLGQASQELLMSATNNSVLAHTPVAFITNNDSSGGSSGSPVLNGEGQLIGLAFDGNSRWLLGDYMYHDELQRCLNLDIRFILYLINQTPAKYIIKELSLNNTRSDQN